MEFEEHDGHELEEEEEDEDEEEEEEDEEEEEIGLPGGYNSSRIKMSNTGDETVSPTTIRKPRYRECLKNHAVGIGGHAVDGCGEFMPAGVEGTLDALKCAACNCHRNFHRKETDVSRGVSGVITGGELLYQQQHHQQQQFSPYYRTPGGYLHVAPHHRPLALPSTSGEGRGTMSRDDEEDMSNPNGSGGMMMTGSGSSKKRFRTKFTSEQKDRMMQLAERLGWRIQKHDEEVVQQFCNESGVKRHVLKVWMHNNKHTIGKKPV